MTITKERLIYTAGTFKIDDDFARCRRFVITMSLLRLPFSARYVNERTNPRKYFLGYMSVFVDQYVHHVVTLEYEAQCLLIWENPSIQLYTTALCLAKVASDNLVALRGSIPLPGAVVPLPFDVATFPGCSFTNLKFKLEPGCRIAIAAAGEEIIECDGISPEATIPDLTPPASPYPPEQAREEDPPRSDPEEGELPGDTAPVTLDDPDSSLTIPPCVLTVGLTRSDLGTEDRYSVEVADGSYTSPFINTIGPGSTYIVQCNGSAGVVTIAGPFSPGSIVITITYVNNTCA